MELFCKIIPQIYPNVILDFQEPVHFEDVKDEIFDMVRPKDPYKITLQDLINCGQGDTVISILIDLNGFWTYENREVLASDNTNIELEDS